MNKCLPSDNILEQNVQAHNEKKDYPVHNTSRIQSDTEFDNSHNKNLNKSEEYAEIMSKINKEADNIHSLGEINIFDKYKSLTSTQIVKEIKNKNKEIIRLSREQEEYKAKLSEILYNLNAAIESSTSKILDREKNPQTLDSLKHMVEIRQRELANAKTHSNTYRQQYDIIYSKANERFSGDKINQLEGQIENFRKENTELIKKVREMKNKQVIKSKELEMCAMNKKYPSQINMYTDEVKNLVAKRLEYLNKLQINRKSVTNLKSYLGKLLQMWNEVFKTGNRNNAMNDNAVSPMEEDLNKLREELNGDEEEILEFFCRENSPEGTENNYHNSGMNNHNPQLVNKLLIKYSGGRNCVHNINSNNFNEGKEKNLPLPNIFLTNGTNKYNNQNNQINRNGKYDLNRKSPENYKRSEKYQSSHSSQSPRKEYKGIFSKYEYLNQKSKKIITNNKITGNLLQKNQSREHANNSIEELFTENSIEKENSDIFATDFENTQNNDFSRLIKKRNQLEKVNQKLEKNLNEVEKLNEKKYKDINNTIEHNQKKLQLINKVIIFLHSKQNELLAVEIEELSNIASLRIQEKKIKKEIKESQTKFIKKVSKPVSINFATSNNTDISETRNDILQELNNILSAEGEKIHKIHKNKNIDSNAIEEEHHGHHDTNSLMNENDNEELEENNIEKENLKFPDISNVEHIDENEFRSHRKHNINDTKADFIQLD